jgi:hypothetical protein
MLIRPEMELGIAALMIAGLNRIPEAEVARRDETTPLIRARRVLDQELFADGKRAFIVRERFL